MLPQHTLPHTLPHLAASSQQPVLTWHQPRSQILTVIFVSCTNLVIETMPSMRHHLEVFALIETVGGTLHMVLNEPHLR